MRKPIKFDDFINAVLKEARRVSLVDICDNWDISEDEMEECLDWLGRLQDIFDIEDSEN